MDREQGATKMLASRGIRLHSIISMFKLLDVLREAERIDSQTTQDVRKFILDNNTFRYGVPGSQNSGEYVRALVESRMFTITAVTGRGMVAVFLRRIHVWTRRRSLAMHTEPDCPVRNLPPVF